jgi:hypothetical protein
VIAQTVVLKVPFGQNVLPGFVAKILGENLAKRVQLVDMDTKTHLKRLTARQNARAATED